ncbi:MAG: hypothetical protein J7L52_00760 [Thermotogae bacterium]|nr:hypothetical protein [Thermotogota bacterium]
MERWIWILIFPLCIIGLSGFADDPVCFEYPVKLIFETIESGKVLENVVLPFLSEYRSSGFSIRVDPSFHIDNGLVKKVEKDEHIVRPYEEFYIYEKTSPFLTLLLDLNGGPLRIHVEYFLKREYMQFHNTGGITNIPYSNVFPHLSLDPGYPYKAYGVLEFDGQYIVFGRCKLRWGEALYPVALSDVSPYYDNFTYHAQGSGVGYTFHLISLNATLTPEEWASQTSFVPPNADPGSPYTERVKTLVAHRLDFLISHNLRVGIGELTMVGGKYPDLYALNPFIIYHNNFNEGYTNTMGIVDFSWTPIKGLNFYGEFALDDLVVPLTETDVKPTAYAFNLGLRKTLSTSFGNFIFGGEIAVATEYVYNTFLPYLKFYNRVKYISTYPISHNLVDYPIGFAYGPDAGLISLRFMYFNEDTEIELEFFNLRKGSRDIYTPYGEQLEKVEKQFLGVSILAKWKRMEFSFIMVDGKWRTGMSWRLF